MRNDVDLCKFMTWNTLKIIWVLCTAELCNKIFLDSLTGLSGHQHSSSTSSIYQFSSGWFTSPCWPSVGTHCSRTSNTRFSFLTSVSTSARNYLQYRRHSLNREILQIGSKILSLIQGIVSLSGDQIFIRKNEMVMRITVCICASYNCRFQMEIKERWGQARVFW